MIVADVLGFLAAVSPEFLKPERRQNSLPGNNNKTVSDIQDDKVPVVFLASSSMTFQYALTVSGKLSESFFTPNTTCLTHSAPFVPAIYCA